MLLISSFALADLTFTQNQLTLSLDYASLRDKDTMLSFSGHSFTITNDGPNPENITLSFANQNAAYRDFVLDATSFGLNVNESRVVHLSGKAPVNLDQGTHTAVVDVRATAISGTAKTATFAADVLPMVEIDKIYVKANDNIVDKIDQDNDRVKGLKPGDRIELGFRLSNRFDKDYNKGDLEGTINIKLDDSDFGDEVDEEQDFSLNAGEEMRSESDHILLSFDIPEDADEGDYSIDINIESKDDNKAKYTLSWDLEMQVKRERDDMDIRDFIVSPQELSCSRIAQISARAVNVGSDSQKYTILRFSNDQLGIDRSFSFSLDQGTSSDNSAIKTFVADIPSSKAAGTYEVVANLYYDQDKLADRKVAKITIKDCADRTQTPKSNASSQTQQTTTTPGVTTPAQPSANYSLPPVQTQEQGPYQSSDYILGVMIVGVILLALLIIIFFIILLK